MNKTFKVVFNRARATLMVANEATSSMKKKGVAKVAALLTSGFISALSMTAYGAVAEHGLTADTYQVFDISSLTMSNQGDMFIYSQNTTPGMVALTGSNINWDNGYSGNYYQGNIISAWGLKSLTFDSFTLKNNQIQISETNSPWAYGAIVLRDQYTQNKTTHKDNVRGDSFKLSNFTIENNTLTVTRTETAYLASGGVFSIWDVDSVEFSNGAVNNNHAILEGVEVPTSEYAASARGGFLEVKRGDVTFTDVVFTNNTAETVAGKGIAMGGAIAADGKEGGNGAGETTNPLTVTFKVSEGKNLVYSGNNVIGGDDKYHDSWGHMDQTGGGFLYLDRGANAAFDIAQGATLTIGNDDATGDMDSIASSFAVNSYTDADGNKHNPITDTSKLSKTGSGTLIINSSLNKYYGTVSVSDGEMRVTKDWTIHNSVTVTGGVLAAENVVLGEIPTINANEAYDPSNENPIDSELTPVGEPVGTITVNGGSVDIRNLAFNQNTNTVSVSDNGTLSVKNFDFSKGGNVKVDGGTLQTASDQVYIISEGVSLFSENPEEVTTDFSDKEVKLATNIALTSGTLSLTDAGYYSKESLTQMTEKANGVTLTIINAQFTGTEAATLVDNVIQSKVEAEVSGTVTDNVLTIESKNSGAQSLIISTEGTDTVDQILLKSKDNTSTSLTLIGTENTADNTKLVTSKTTGESLAVTVAENMALNLGSSSSANETYGSLSSVYLVAAENGGDAAKLFINNSDITVEKLTAENGTLITVGSSDSRGTLSVENIALQDGSTIFVDPAWEDGVEIQSIGKASHLEISKVGTDSLSGKIIAGQNSLVTLGATTQDAISAFNSLNGLAWGPENITAALYLGQSITPTGGILVNGSESTTANSAVTEGSVTLAANALLIVDQAALDGTTAIDGTLTADSAAKVAVMNASVGETKLATSVTGLTIDQVVTDNAFISANKIDIATGTVTTAVEGESLSGAFSSLGLQAMTRRADTMLATSIADRTSIDQDFGEGLSLWVDVAGERYEADGLDNGGEFHSDMGYGTFGGDIQIAENVRVGAAIQYGSGSARSDNYGIKNSIDSYGISLYGSYSFGDAKLVGEIAYVKNENDITADATSGLSQSVDTEILSAGVRAQYALTAGQFRFMPSIGLRVSQLKSDEVKVGNLAFGDDDLTLVQVPVALRISGFDMQAQGWQLSPSFKIAYVPTFGDKDVSIYGVDQTVIDTNSVQGDFGLRATNGNMMINANFMFGTGKEGTSAVGGKIGMKYVF